MTKPTAIDNPWRENSWYGTGVVQVADHESGAVLIRDNTDPDRPLAVGPVEFRRFLTDVRAGRFDHIGFGETPFVGAGPDD